MMNIIKNRYPENSWINRISSRGYLEICSSAGDCPFSDFKESVRELFKELTARDGISRKSLMTLAGSTLMGLAATSTLNTIFNKVVYQETYSNLMLAVHLIGMTTLSLVGISIVIFEKAIARGLENYKAIIEEETLKSKTTKEGMALIFDPVSDWNGAFDLDLLQATNYEQLSHRFRIASKKSPVTSEIWTEIHRQADQRENILLLELQGHGTPDYTELSDTDSKGEDKFNYFSPNLLTGYELELETALDRLNPNAIILIRSCSAAGESKGSIAPCPNWKTRNTAYRIAALANKRTVIASTENSSTYIIENDPKSPYQGLNVKILNKDNKNTTLHIQENEQNTHEFEEIRSGIYAARAYVDIENAVLKLKEKEGFKKSDPINLCIQSSEKIKRYVQFTLQGILGNRVGVKNVEYVKNIPDATTYQILGEPTKFFIMKKSAEN